MKRMLVTLLTFLLLFTTTAFAQGNPDLELPEATIDFDSLQYEGDWWSFNELNLKLYFPSNWVENTSDYAGGADYEFAFNAEDKSAYINIRVFMDDSAEDYATRFQEMLEEMSGSAAASDVSPVRLNGIDMITYTIGEDTGLGAVVVTNDAFLMFESAPGTEENAGLFLQILSTYKLVEEE